jgi:rhamnose transport system substrate-binding protein
MLADQLVDGKEAAPGETFSIGRVGEVTLDDTNSAAMAVPFQFDKTNIEEFAKIY